MKTPRISVLMPAYNAQEYIGMAIESILNQTFTDFQFIIINDGSTDNTPEIIERYARRDKRIKFINHKINSGLISVLNEGLGLARAEYIARMDSDDVSLPTRFEKQIKYMDMHQQCGVLGTWFQCFGKANDVVRHPKRIKLLNLLDGPGIGHPTVMLRKSIMDQYGLQYDMNYKHAEDYELWSRMVLVTEIHNLPEILLNYRWIDTNISVIHANAQQMVANRVKNNILGCLSSDTDVQTAITRLIATPHKKLYKYGTLRRINVDDSQILSELNKFETFSYMPNSGNLGDMLIASATMDWFDTNKLKWVRTKPNEYPKTFVYGGGGAWIHNYISGMTRVIDIMQHAEHIVVLPSSFNNVPELVKVLDKRFVIFCRDRKSYDYMLKQHTGAKIILDHDMALRMTRIPKTPKILSKYFWKTSRLWYKQKILPKTINLLRTDSETLGKNATDLDLSEYFGWFDSYSSRATIDFAARTMLRFIQKFNIIHTDRLHVAIAGILTRKTVFMQDNSYGKLSSVYENSLEQIPNVYFENNKNTKRNIK